MAARLPVLVVGGGPAGLAVAANLALGGVEAAVFETEPKLPRTVSIPPGVSNRAVTPSASWVASRNLWRQRTLPPRFSNRRSSSGVSLNCSQWRRNG